MIPWLDRDTPFPPVEHALREPNGLLAAGGELSVDRLLAAYRGGIFPWFSEGEPLLWWSPDPRMVLFTDQLKVSRSLARSARNRGYEIRIDTAFAAVLEGCAGPRRNQPSTWLGPEMRAAYLQLHRIGYAHSFETWHRSALAGGLYGMAVGRMFFGESMFSCATDASKVALVGLVEELRLRGFPMIDCQMNTAHLASLGAREIPRAEFLRAVSGLVHYPEAVGRWRRTERQHESTSCHG